MNLRNQRGGIFSSIFIVPAGVVVIIAVFLLGYYVGRRQTIRLVSDEKPVALPEVVSQYLPEKEEFTFYKTLTEKGDKTLSIELKTKPNSNPERTAVASSDTPVEKPRSAAKTLPAPARSAIAEKSSTPKVRYTIQIGSYPDRLSAEEDVKAMKKRGYAAFLVTTELPEKGTWYRVRIGSFANRQSAEKLAAELRSKEGINPFLTVE